jgi:hypothetical protein
MALRGQRVIARISSAISDNNKEKARKAVERIDNRVKAEDNWSQLTSDEQTAVNNARASAVAQWSDLD